MKFYILSAECILGWTVCKTLPFCSVTSCSCEKGYWALLACTTLMSMFCCGGDWEWGYVYMYWSVPMNMLIHLIVTFPDRIPHMWSEPGVLSDLSYHIHTCMYYILRLRALIRWQITHTHVVLNPAPVTDYILNQIGSRENSQPVSGSLKRFELLKTCVAVS